MSFFKRNSRRVLYGLGGSIATVATGCTLLSLPPKESLPEVLLFPRVTLEGLGRAARSARVGSQIIMDYKRTVTDEDSQEAWDAVHERAARGLLELCEQNGGLYIKTGQDFARLNHLMPPQFVKALQKLHDDVCRRPVGEVKAVIESDLGRPVSEIFHSFDERPLAAASLAQVHRAQIVVETPTKVIQPDGSGTKKTIKDVAVKVQYIDVIDRFRGDMATIQLMMKVTSLFFPGADFTEIIQRLEGVVENELDFVKEGRSAERCAADWNENGFSPRVYVPQVQWGFTSTRVLTTEFIDGVKVTDLKGMKRRGLSVKAASEAMVDAFAHQVFVSGLVHCDPHPGNLLVRSVPGDKSQTQLVVLDFGLCVELSLKTRNHMSRMWNACLRHETQRVIDLCAEVDIPDWPVFAACFLEQPYEGYSPFRRMTSESDLAAMRKFMNTEMQRITDCFEKLPVDYTMAMRNITNVRATQKIMGSPICRTARMFTTSLKAYKQHRFEGQEAITWLWSLRMSCFVYWLMIQEVVSNWVLAYAMWKDPRLKEMFDDVRFIG